MIVGHVVGLIFKFALGHDQVYGLVPMFDLNQESNVPTCFSSLLHLCAAVCLALIAAARHRVGDKIARQWILLALVFCYTSLDEAARIHELTMAPTRDMVGATGLFYFAWVIPAMIVLAIMGVYFLKFFLQLPRKTRNMFFLSAAIFLGGALGVELPEGYWYERYGKENLVYGLLTGVEESLEMLGLVCFIHALVGYLAEFAPMKSVRISFVSGRSE